MNWTFSGLSGISGLPAEYPPGYTKPITDSNGTVLANAVFNIQQLPGNGVISLTGHLTDHAAVRVHPGVGHDRLGDPRRHHLLADPREAVR
jgi:hypothetical protein